jgi:hypothetical protein
MKTRPRPVRMPAKAKPKAKGATRAAKPRKAASKSKAPSKTVAKAKPSKPTPSSAGGEWRAATLDHVRTLILEADPAIVEEVKWRKASNNMQGVPTWSHDGLICTGETYKDKVKFTFARGAALEDPTGLFNADDKGSTRRAIDLREGQMVDAGAFKSLVQAAVDLNAERAD